MIYKLTKLTTLDNSGALLVQIFRVLRSKYEHAKIGDTVIISIKKAKVGKKVKKGEVKQGVVVQTKKKLYRKHKGISICFENNNLVILGRGLNPLGTRIKGTVTQELRRKKYMRILTMAPSVI